MTAAHNTVRAALHAPAPSPALPPLSWSSELAAIAQAYAETLAQDCMLTHSNNNLGENLAYYAGSSETPEQVVESWASEEECYTYGAFNRGDACDMTCAEQHFSNGCGHYTQIIWRDTSQVGCGVAICDQTWNGLPQEIWVCNYQTPGNYIGQTPY